VIRLGFANMKTTRLTSLHAALSSVLALAAGCGAHQPPPPPAQAAAPAAAPGRPVICFTGDGGFWYHLSELETASRFNINVVTVINNNHSLNQEKGGNERLLGGRRSAQSDSFWLFPETDFARVAESLGCIGIVVTRPDELPGALTQAFAADRPVVIDVRTHLDGIAPLGWAPG